MECRWQFGSEVSSRAQFKSKHRPVEFASKTSKEVEEMHVSAMGLGRRNLNVHTRLTLAAEPQFPAQIKVEPRLDG